MNDVYFGGDGYCNDISDKSILIRKSSLTL